jgi:hypothetical protein
MSSIYKKNKLETIPEDLEIGNETFNSSNNDTFIIDDDFTNQDYIFLNNYNSINFDTDKCHNQILIIFLMLVLIICSLVYFMFKNKQLWYLAFLVPCFYFSICYYTCYYIIIDQNVINIWKCFIIIVFFMLLIFIPIIMLINYYNN